MAERLSVGLSLSLSGGYAAMGRQAEAAIKLFVEVVNEKFDRGLGLAAHRRVAAAQRQRKTDAQPLGHRKRARAKARFRRFRPGSPPSPRDCKFQTPRKSEK